MRNFSMFVVFVYALVGCGGSAEGANLSQDFYGRWEGMMEIQADQLGLTVPVSVGLTIDGKNGFVTDLCPSYVENDVLVGSGTNETLEVRGTVRCAPAQIGECSSVVVTWDYISVLLMEEKRTHVTASGTIEGCDRASPFLGIADLVRVSH